MNSNEVCFAQISDLHLSQITGLNPRQFLSKRLLGYLSWLRRRRYEHDQEVLAVLARDLVSMNPDQLLICGDLTHLGLPDEFRQVRRWLDALGIGAISLVPGNHDSYVKEPWSSTYSHWLPYMAVNEGRQPSSFEEVFPSLTIRGTLAFIGLSSAEPTAPFFATGRLGEEQLARLGKLLEETARQGLFRVVYLHHPPVPGTEKWRKRLRDAAELTELLKSSGAEVVLHGHGHRWQMLKINSSDIDIPVLGVASASALGHHGESASYNLFRVIRQEGGWLLEVERRQYKGDEKQFLPLEKRTLHFTR